MPRRLLIGAHGQLGTDLVRLLERRGEGEQTTAVDVDTLDITDHAATRQLLEELEPALVINLAAYHQVDKCETHAEEAFAVNETAVAELAVACTDVGATLVHFSTDFVFDGELHRDAPFTEEDAPSPQSVYARSKLAGERRVLAGGGAHFVVRTCGLYGVAAAEGRSSNFVETMLRLADAGKSIRVVDDQRLAPTATHELAPRILELVDKGAPGLYHATNAGSCTWFEFAGEVFRLAGLTPDLAPTTSAEYAAPARRPAYSVLSNAKLHAAGVSPLPPWQAALAGYMRLRQEVLT